MSPEALFQIANPLVLPGWALLLFAPRWRGTQRVCAFLLPALLGAAYAVLFASQAGRMEGGFGSLPEVARLFANPTLLLVGWLHYLAFDLFVGAWQVRDARRHGMPHLAVAPCLVLTFLAGPAGLLLYFGVRGALKRVWEV